MPISVARVSDLKRHKGAEIGTTEWLRLTQNDVDLFARVTRDPDWMHVDVDRARQGPVGTTIVQGFLTLSMMLYFSHRLEFLPPERVEYAFNYGLNRVRWVEPVKVDARIRDKIVLQDLEERDSGRFLVTTTHTIEIENCPKPAMVAEWLGLVKERD